jgi:dUTP pyrophosphatase
MKFYIDKELDYAYDYTIGKIYESLSSFNEGVLFLNDAGLYQFVCTGDIVEVEEDSIFTDTIEVKYFDNNLPKLEITEKGDCIDLRVSKVYRMKSHSGLPMKDKEEVEFPYHYHNDDVLFFKLGVGMKLPKGYKANVYPRSSTFKNYGFILTNSVGIIDNSYCGNTDEWAAMMYCTREGVINYGDRILQFEPVPVYTHNFSYEEVEELDEDSRGGYGSTGVK